MKGYACTHVGRQRDHNEDDVLRERLTDDAYLLAVADGMGGHRAGDVASDIATTELKRAVVGAVEDEDEFDPGTVLVRGIGRANDVIRARIEEMPEYDGMGTTLVAAIVRNGEAVVANVGDSRAYHVDETMEQVTKDHSLVRELVDAGSITEAEARTHPQRNVVTQALGLEDSVEPDIFELDLGGTLLLCSDGLTEEVAEPVIAEIVRNASDLREAGDQLVERANENGGSDNVSVVLANR